MKRLYLLVTGICVAAFSPLVTAQNYPTKTIQIVVPAQPGGGNDFLARLFAVELQKRVGQSVVVENRAGAGGLIGADFVARAAPDGHTILAGNDSVLTIPNFVNTGFNAERDLQAVAAVSAAPRTLIASTGVPAKTLKDFVAYARANPGKINVAYLQNSSMYLDTLRFVQLAGIDVQLVPYPGGYAQILRALLGNEVQAVLGSMVGAIANNVQSGNLTALAVASAQPMPRFPATPTAKSAGIDFDSTAWQGFFVPAATPRVIAQRLSKELVDIARQRDIQSRIQAEGSDPRAIPMDEAQSIFATQIRLATEAARAAGIQKTK